MNKINNYLKTGYETIDREHRIWIASVNSIIEALEKEKGKDELRKNILFLILFTIKHFSAEEDTMLTHNYSEYSTHKNYHEKFKMTLLGLAHQLQKKDSSEGFTDNVVFNIRDWMIYHINNHDFKMAAYIK